MNLFVLGVMPAYLLVQLFMGKSLRMIAWHAGVGILFYLPFLAIKGLALNAGLHSDHMTLLSEWRLTFIRDYLMPLGYIVLILPILLRCKVVFAHSVLLSALLAVFFMMDGIVVVLFSGIADGFYELLLRPLYYLFFVMLLVQLFTVTKWRWLMLLTIVLVAVAAPFSYVFVFMNQDGLAWFSAALLVLFSAGSLVMHAHVNVLAAKKAQDVI